MNHFNVCLSSAQPSPYSILWLSYLFTTFGVTGCGISQLQHNIREPPCKQYLTSVPILCQPPTTNALLVLRPLPSSLALIHLKERILRLVCRMHCPSDIREHSRAITCPMAREIKETGWSATTKFCVGRCLLCDLVFIRRNHLGKHYSLQSIHNEAFGTF